MKKAGVSLMIVAIGLAFLFGCKSKPEIERKIQTDEGFQWYRTKIVEKDKNGNKDLIYFGAESTDGTTLIPLERKYTNVRYSSVFEMFEVYRYHNEGLCDKTGKEIISPDREYNNIWCYSDPNYLLVYKDKVRGVLDINGNEIISTSIGYTDIEDIKKNGDIDGPIKYFRVTKNNYEGILDLNGNVVISTDRGYDGVTLWQNLGFYTGKNNFSGFCDIDGNEIIAPNKYDNIEIKDYDNYFEVEKDGYKGACDINGKEIVPPIYDYVWYNDSDCEFECTRDESEGDHWIEKRKIIKFDTEKVVKKNFSSSSSSSDGFTSKDGLLYEGDYTEGPWVSTQNGYSQPSINPHHHIKIYEDYLIDGVVKIPYIGKSIDGKKKYHCSFPENDYVIDSYFNIIIYAPGMYNQLVKGNVVYDINTPVQDYNGGGGGNYDIDNKKNGKISQPKRHQCGLCGGSGEWAHDDASIPDFGTGNKYCSKCGKTVGPKHVHTQCPSCKGKGWW